MAALFRARDGVTAIEFAVILPTLMLLVAGLCDFGLATYADIQVQQAAEAGAAYAQVYGYTAPGTGIIAAVTAATPLRGSIQANPAPLPRRGCIVSGTAITWVDNATVTCPGGENVGIYVTVTAQMTYTTLIPWIGLPGSFRFQSEATVRTQ